MRPSRPHHPSGLEHEFGSFESVIAFLKKNPTQRIALSRIHPKVITILSDSEDKRSRQVNLVGNSVGLAH